MNKHIKLLVENIFDDMLREQDLQDNDLFHNNIFNKLNFQLFLNVIHETLCLSTTYHLVRPDVEDGLTLIRKDDNDNNVYHIAPKTNYKLENLGPRKRKRYPIEYFYWYKITLDYHVINIEVHHKLRNKALIINEALCEFINKSPYAINKLTYCTYVPDLNHPISVSDMPEKIYIFNGGSARGENLFSDKFVDNFPEIITPQIPEKYIDFNPNGTFITRIYTTLFTSNKIFILFIKKLINGAGANIVDEKSLVYNRENIDKMENELLSGKIEQEINDIKQNRIKFITEQLGLNYIDKFNEIVDYYKNKKRYNNVYLKLLNTLRKEKISANITIPGLLKDNNININTSNITINDIINNNMSFYNNKSYEDNMTNHLYTTIYTMILHKMFYNIIEYNLNQYKYTIYHNLSLYIVGVENDFGSTQKININDLPIKLNNIESIYILYYIIGCSIKQSSGIILFLNDKLNNTKNNNYDEDSDYYDEDYNDDQQMIYYLGNNIFAYIANNNIDLIEKYNINIKDISDFDFSYLNKQFKLMIDNAYKKIR